MGPEFPLQRVTVRSQGYIVAPTTSESADCETLHFKHPDYKVKTSATIPLIGDSYEEPGQCENSK